jgi:hypothetical protein
VLVTITVGLDLPETMIGRPAPPPRQGRLFGRICSVFWSWRYSGSAAPLRDDRRLQRRGLLTREGNSDVKCSRYRGDLGRGPSFDDALRSHSGESGQMVR